MEIQEKINELMQKQEFVEAFQAVTSPEDVVDLFGRNGIEVPIEIAQELFQPVNAEAELPEEALDNVAGGGIGSNLGSYVFWGAGYLGGRLAGWSPERSRRYASKCSKLGGVLGGAMEWAIGAGL